MSVSHTFCLEVCKSAHRRNHVNITHILPGSLQECSPL